MYAAEPTGSGDAAAVDPDVDLHVPAQRDERRAHPWLLPAISLGGMVGASARHGIELAWPPSGAVVPWATLGVNVSGCLLIGVLMAYVAVASRAHPLVRPFLGVGVLGGYTTFSTYTVQSYALMLDGRAAVAFPYLLGTVAAAVPAVALGLLLGRAAFQVRQAERS